MSQPSITNICLKITYLKISLKFPRGQRVKLSLTLLLAWCQTGDQSLLSQPLMIRTTSDGDTIKFDWPHPRMFPQQVSLVVTYGSDHRGGPVLLPGFAINWSQNQVSWFCDQLIAKPGNRDTWFCDQLIAKPGNKTGPPVIWPTCTIICHITCTQIVVPRFERIWGFDQWCANHILFKCNQNKIHWH